jgi:DnaJ-class molecular chaperone
MEVARWMKSEREHLPSFTSARLWLEATSGSEPPVGVHFLETVRCRLEQPADSAVGIDVHLSAAGIKHIRQDRYGNEYVHFHVVIPK